MENDHLERRLAALRAALKDSDESVRKAASRALEKLEAYADLDALVERFRDGNHVEKIRVIYAFGRIRSELSLKALVYALRSEDAEISTAAARALGEMHDDRALGPLTEALQSADTTTKVEILSVLPNFRHPNIVEAIRAGLRSKDIDVVDAAIQALGKVGDRDSEPQLLMILEKGPPRLRRSAAAALGDLEI